MMKIISNPGRWPSARPSSSDCTLYTALIMVVAIIAFRRHRHNYHVIITSLIFIISIISHTRHHVFKDDQVSPPCADYRFQNNSYYSGINRKHKYLKLVF